MSPLSYIGGTTPPTLIFLGKSDHIVPTEQARSLDQALARAGVTHATYLLTAAAAGMALINSVGNVGGFLGPFVVGWIKDSTGSFDNGLYALAGFMLLAAIITTVGVQAPRRRLPAGLQATPAE